MPTRPRPLAHDETQHGTALRAQRQTDAQLPGALRHRQRHDPVQADARQDQCQHRERAQQHHGQPARRQFVGDAPFHRRDFRHRHLGIERQHLALDGIRDLQRIAGSDVDDHRRGDPVS